MANMQKYTRNALGHMLKHYAREKDQNGEYVKFGNVNIAQYCGAAVVCSPNGQHPHVL